MPDPTEWLLALQDAVTPLRLWMVLCISGFGMPEELPLLVGGTTVARGGMSWAQALLVGWSGMLTRDLGAYLLGRVASGPLLGWASNKTSGVGAKMAQAQAVLAQKGASAVWLARASFGIRVPMYVVAGATGLPLHRFLLVDGLALCVTVPLTMVVGALVGPLALQYLGHIAVVGPVLLLALALVAWRRRATASA